MENVLVNQRYQPFLAIVKGFRNGFIQFTGTTSWLPSHIVHHVPQYGLKIRFPHSLVMTFLFHEGTLKEKMIFILRATFQHAKNLAFLTTIYKSILLLLRKLQGHTLPIHNFIGAFVAGYFVFGENNKVNMQINLYLLSRITLGLVKLAVKKGYVPEPKFDVFPWFAALMWGTVLFLFENHQETLQQSLQSSMTYIYHDSMVWSNILDFLLYNNDSLW